MPDASASDVSAYSLVASEFPNVMQPPADALDRIRMLHRNFGLKKKLPWMRRVWLIWRALRREID